MKNCSEHPAYKRLPHPIRSAAGVEVRLEDGRELLDLYGGHCVNTLGAGNPAVLAAIQEQWNTLSFATNFFEHPARERFLEAFDRIVPPGEWRVFLSNSGAEANENALKAALAATGRAAVVCFEGAFHGRTAASWAVGDGKGFAFPQVPFEVRRLPFGDASALEGALDGDVGAVILEPIQSMAGIVEPPTGYLEALRAACDATGALLVFDEVQTGNGRLGTPWASQTYEVIPDLFTTAKGAACGLPIGITVIAAEVSERLPAGLFGSTFGGGPTVLAAATVVAEHLADQGFLDGVAAASGALRGAGRVGPVTRVRGRGLLLGLELEAGLEGKSVRDELFEAGVIVGVSNDPGVLRLTPPLVLRPEHAPRLETALDSLGVTS